MDGILAGLSIAVFILNLFFVCWVYRGLRKISTSTIPSNTIPQKFSIIIAAHNEAHNIGKCLNSLTTQNYPKVEYEVIVVADRCSDNTVQTAAQFQSEISCLKILEIDEVPPGMSPKKYALDKGIQAASHDHFLFLDADVTPTSNHLKIMNSYFSKNTDVVVGIMKLSPGKLRWYPILAYERLMNWSVAGGAIGNKMPIIAYGGDWGYTRQAFKKIEGFKRIFHSLGGDDDLLLQQFGKAGLTIQFCTHPDGWVETEAPESFKEFLHQRKRHFSAGRYYQNKFKAGYFLYHTSNFLIWILPFLYFPAVIFLGLKLLCSAGLLKISKGIFEEKINPIAVPVFEFMIMLYNTIIGPLGFIGRIKW